MSYSHYGKIGDVWKHLSLCSFLNSEKPKKYIEINSSKAYYKLSNTPEQNFGVYTFLSESPKSNILVNSPYYRILKKSAHKKIYKFISWISSACLDIIT
jgi:23S rRNA (adenine2030-N6)-methyltransferase